MSELWSFIIYSEIYHVQNLLNADFFGLGNSSLASVCISVHSGASRTHTLCDKKDYGCVQMFQLAVTAAVETPCRLYILAITGPRTALLWHSETFPVTGLVSCDLYRCTLHCCGLSLTLKFSGSYDETSKLSGTG